MIANAMRLPTALEGKKARISKMRAAEKMTVRNTSQRNRLLRCLIRELLSVSTSVIPL